MIEAPAARPPGGSAGHDTEAILLSVTVIADTILTRPELVTVKVYGTLVPTALNAVDVVFFASVRAGAATAIVVAAALLAALPSLVAPVVPVTLEVATVVGVPETVQVIAAPAARLAAGTVGEHAVVRPAGNPLTAHVAFVAASAGDAASVHVKVPE